VRYYAPAGVSCGPLPVKLIGVCVTSFAESSYKELQHGNDPRFEF